MCISLPLLDVITGPMLLLEDNNFFYFNLKIELNNKAKILFFLFGSYLNNFPIIRSYPEVCLGL